MEDILSGFWTVVIKIYLWNNKIIIKKEVLKKLGEFH